MRRATATVTLAVFVTWSAIPSGVAKLPLRSLLKNDLGLGAEDMATFFAVAGLAWYVKPLAGLLSDQLPLLGARRVPYLLLGGGGAALAWAAAAAAPPGSAAMLAALVAVNVCAVLANSAAGGLMVDVGRTHRVLGRLSAIRLAAMNAAAVVGGTVGGWLAGRSFAWTCGVCASLMTVMVLAARTLPIREPRPHGARPLRAVLRAVGGQVIRREVLAVTVLTALFYIAPGIGSLFYYHQCDVLRLTDPQIGLLAGLYCVGGVLGALAYTRFCGRLPLGVLVAAGIGLNGASALLYVLYDSLAAGLVIEPVLGFLVMLGLMPLYELMARACPIRHEALVFAWYLGIGNAAIAVSEVLGTGLARALEIDMHGMIAVYAAGTTLAGLGLLWVPKRLLGPGDVKATRDA